MERDTKIWLERLSTLHHSQIRKVVNAEKLQVVHFEILYYLSICNRYSNTAQAISEYFGQTKGSISQSLKFLEEQGYVARSVDLDDKRYVRLSLTVSGAECLARMAQDNVVMPSSPETAEILKKLLLFWQKSHGMKIFGLCTSCKYNQKKANGAFVCGLTGEALSKSDSEKICREHEFV